MGFNTKETYIIATTGCLGTELDSMESIIAGSEAGATGCAVPLDMTADGIAVLCSNGGFTLPDDSFVALAENSYEEVRKAHLKVVTIGQIIELAKSVAGKLCINLKNTMLCAQTKLALTHADYLEETYFVGVGMHEACRIAKAQPALHVMADVVDSSSVINESALVRSAQEGGLCGLRVSPNLLTPTLVSEAHHVGLVIATTETAEKDVLKRLIDMQVNFIETSRPDIAYELMPKSEEPQEETPAMPPLMDLDETTL